MTAGAELRGLYAVTESGLARTGTLLGKVAQAIAGGARLVQYRDKGGDPLHAWRQARELVDLCRSCQVPLIVNDDPVLARAIGAQGVHVGRRDMSVIQARELLGNDAIIGASCYNDLDLASAAQASGADYVAFGSFFPSPTKPDAARADIGLLVTAKEQLSIPVCAIGGVTTDNAPLLIKAGADLLAVIGGLFAQADVESAARRFSEAFYKPAPN